MEKEAFESDGPSGKPGFALNTSTPKVVISGAGLATPLGLSCQQTWDAVRAGRCGLGPLTAMEQPLPPGSTGGQAPDLSADLLPGQPREVRYLSHAISEALRDAEIEPAKSYPPDRCGIMLGTTLHGMRAAGRFLRSNNHELLADFLAGGTLHGGDGRPPLYRIFRHGLFGLLIEPGQYRPWHLPAFKRPA